MLKHLIVLCLLCVPLVGHAQEVHVASTSEFRVQEIVSQSLISDGVYQYVLEAVSEDGMTRRFATEDSYTTGVGFEIREGDRLFVQALDTPEGTEYYIDDISRSRAVWWILAIFAGLTLLIGRMRGALSLVGLIVTVGLLVGWLFPAILSGADPVSTTLIVSAVILGVNMHLSHGLNPRTFVAYVGTLAGLALVYVFTHLFLSISRLSGLVTDEATKLFWELDPVQIPVGILAAGIILGAVGVLDDVAITQMEVTDEIAAADPTLSKSELFARGMRIGRHHIASTVNTLILVYAGAALPAFLLFMHQFGGYAQFFENELVVEELVRTLAGTSALVLTVPLSTWLAVSIPWGTDAPHTH